MSARQDDSVDLARRRVLIAGAGLAGSFILGWPALAKDAVATDAT